MSNTSYLDDGNYAVFSSISLNGSGATLAASAITVSGTAYFAQGLQAVGVNINNSSAWLTLPDGVAIGPASRFSSEASLGIFRSANSIMALSYGWFKANYISSATTDQSGATAKITNQGQLYFSVLSLTSNGGEFGFRSGNTVYRFASIAVG